MGYELSITRDTDNPITAIEWQHYIDQDILFKNVDEFAFKSENVKYSISLSYGAVWSSSAGDVPFVFNENRGTIAVKNPNQMIINKMIEIANFLHAQVIGEEGEEYLELGNT